MSLHRSVKYVLCLLLLCVAGCGGGSGQVSISSRVLSNRFTNAIDETKCSTIPAIDQVSPAGQVYACKAFIVVFSSSGSSTNSGTYHVTTALPQGNAGTVELEAGTWQLSGNVLTCTSTKNGVPVSATGLLDADLNYHFPEIPSYTPQIKIKFLSGAYAGQTVTYFNDHPPI